MGEVKPKDEPESGQDVLFNEDEEEDDDLLEDVDESMTYSEDDEEDTMTDDKTDDKDDSDDKTETSQGSLPEGNEEGESEETQAQEDDSDELSDEERQELADRTKHIDYTVKLISSQNMGILVGETDNWINFDADLSALDKESMRDRLESLWDSGDAIATGINLTVVNKGTETEPELRFVDFNSEPKDDDFEPMSRDDMDMDDDDNSQGSSRSAGENDLSASASYDQAMEALKSADGVEHFSIETSEPLMKHIDDELVVFIKATVEIQPVEGRNHKHQGTGTNSGDDGARSIANDSAIEVAETRAVKRAIRNTGVLIDGED